MTTIKISGGKIMNTKKILSTVILISCLSAQVFATPSTQIWNPSTDIQKKGTYHLGVDNYFNNKISSVIYGLTYGLHKNIEVGIDIAEATNNPLTGNIKFGIEEKDKTPAAAVGVFNAGNSDIDSVVYGVVAKTFNKIGRISAGLYSCDSKSGPILSWDKTLSKKIWASLDTAFGNNSYSAFTGGISYAFTDSVSMIVGFVKPLRDNDDDLQYTTQLDINI
jgi:hypothetical protein